jgi:hypothetical protein
MKLEFSRLQKHNTLTNLRRRRRRRRRRKCIKNKLRGFRKDPIMGFYLSDLDNVALLFPKKIYYSLRQGK